MPKAVVVLFFSESRLSYSYANQYPFKFLYLLLPEAFSNVFKQKLPTDNTDDIGQDDM